MSVYKFPSANAAKLQKISRLLEDLLENNSDPVQVDSTIEFITYAHSCAIVETILSSSEIQLIHPYDPAIVLQLIEALDDCR